MHILFGTFSGIIHVNHSQNLLAFFLPAKYEEVDWHKLIFVLNIRRSYQLESDNTKSSSVIISGKRTQLIDYYALSCQILKKLLYFVFFFFMLTYVKKKSCAIYSHYPNIVANQQRRGKLLLSK